MRVQGHVIYGIYVTGRNETLPRERFLIRLMISGCVLPIWERMKTQGLKATGFTHKSRHKRRLNDVWSGCHAEECLAGSKE